MTHPFLLQGHCPTIDDDEHDTQPAVRCAIAQLYPTDAPISPDQAPGAHPTDRENMRSIIRWGSSGRPFRRSMRSLDVMPAVDAARARTGSGPPSIWRSAKRLLTEVDLTTNQRKGVTQTEGSGMTQRILWFPPNVSASGRAVPEALASLRPGQTEEEGAALTHFAAHINSLSNLDDAPPAVRSHILEAIKTVAGRVDVDRCQRRGRLRSSPPPRRPGGLVARGHQPAPRPGYAVARPRRVGVRCDRPRDRARPPLCRRR